jgi:hypothetical protein
MRFFHYVKNYTLVTVEDQMPVPPEPAIYDQRGPVAPFFYTDTFRAFPREFETFVFLPKLFLSNQWKECKNASFKMLAFDEGKLQIHFKRYDSI